MRWNPLGSHKGVHKIGAIYLSLKCFPPHLCSSLDSIHVCALFPANNKNNLRMLKKIVRDMNQIYNDGILIHNKLIKFCGILGDNLGLHQLCGFIESFSANFPCPKK